MSTLPYHYRPAVESDLDFLYDLHEVTLRGVRAAEARLPATLRVFEINHGARRLYQRLGFAIVGENETHYDMRYG